MVHYLQRVAQSGAQRGSMARPPTAAPPRLPNLRRLDAAPRAADDAGVPEPDPVEQPLSPLAPRPPRFASSVPPSLPVFPSSFPVPPEPAAPVPAPPAEALPHSMMPEPEPPPVAPRPVVARVEGEVRRPPSSWTEPKAAEAAPNRATEPLTPIKTTPPAIEIEDTARQLSLSAEVVTAVPGPVETPRAIAPTPIVRLPSSLRNASRPPEMSRDVPPSRPLAAPPQPTTATTPVAPAKAIAPGTPAAGKAEARPAPVLPRPKESEPTPIARETPATRPVARPDPLEERPEFRPRPTAEAPRPDARPTPALQPQLSLQPRADSAAIVARPASSGNSGQTRVTIGRIEIQVNRAPPAPPPPPAPRSAPAPPPTDLLAPRGLARFGLRP